MEDNLTGSIVQMVSRDPRLKQIHGETYLVIGDCIGWNNVPGAHRLLCLDTGRRTWDTDDRLNNPDVYRVVG